VVLTVTPAAEASWARAGGARVVARIYEPAGDLAAPADVAERAESWISAFDPAGYVQLLNEPDVEYPSKRPEQFAVWWDQCAGYLLRRFPALRLGFPCPSVGGPTDYLPRVAAAGGLTRASFLAERGYWQGAGGWVLGGGASARCWERSAPYRLPIVLTEYGDSSPTTPKAAKAQEYLDYCASLPRYVVPAGAFIGAAGDPRWDSEAAGRLWIDDAMCQLIGAGEGVRSEVSEQNVRRYTALIEKYAGLNRLSASIVAGLIDVESGGNPDATSADNGTTAGGARLGHALGLMQVLEGAFKPGEDGHDPETNLRVGCEILRAKLDVYGDRLDSGLAAYFGVVDSQGNPTDATDLTGTSGTRYVQLVEDAAKVFADLDAAAASLADPDFRSYAPQTGTWREAAVNLKGVADDALARGRQLVKLVDDAASTAAGLWGGR
jgi:soluble lytic murein transglycosylase-like protein